MADSDPFIAISDWRGSLYRGDPAHIDSFLETIETTLPKGWVRDLNHERSRLRPSRIRCYLHDVTGDASVRLWLQRVTDTRVRGGPVQLLRHSPSGAPDQIGQQVSEFMDACVTPAAKQCGIRCTRPGFGARSAVTPAADMLFVQFADTADGEWPLGKQAQEVWDEVVSTCLAEQVAIDRNELCQWLVDSGWDQAVVTAISDQFFADSEWLAKRLGVAAP